MKKILLFVLTCSLPFMLFSQEEEEKTHILKKGYYDINKPVRPGFTGDLIIDGKTTHVPMAKTLEFLIQHRFGSMENGLSDLFGIYGTANTKLAFNYSITDWLFVGYGLSKYRMTSDFQAKILLLRQTRDNKIPVDVALYGNFAIDGRNERNFGMNYEFANRFTYFSELMIARKFTHWFVLQAGVSFTHFNAVEPGYEHDKIGLHFLAHARFTPQSAILVNFDWPLIVTGIAENIPIKDPPKPNLAFGYEVSTSTHVFQIFAGTTTMLVPQYVTMLNQNDFTKGEFYIGFNMNRLWSF
jgi:hypothetical protein